MERIKCFIVFLVIVSTILNAHAEEIITTIATKSFKVIPETTTSTSSPTFIHLNGHGHGHGHGHKAHAKQFECGSEENRHIGTFTIYDYSIVIGMLVISLGIGVFYGFFNSSENTSSDFLHGSEMSLLPVTLSLTTSFITAIELLGNPSEITFYGTQFSLIIISMLMVIPVALKIFYPIYFKLQLTSCYEYLGIRFGKNIRIFGAILYIIQVNR